MNETDDVEAYENSLRKSRRAKLGIASIAVGILGIAGGIVILELMQYGPATDNDGFGIVLVLAGGVLLVNGIRVLLRGE